MRRARQSSRWRLRLISRRYRGSPWGLHPPPVQGRPAVRRIPQGYAARVRLRLVLADGSNPHFRSFSALLTRRLLKMASTSCALTLMYLPRRERSLGTAPVFTQGVESERKVIRFFQVSQYPAMRLD